MKPMPKEIAERWLPMWGEGAHPERPWWCAVHAQVADGPRVRWRRGDGVYTSYYKVPVTWGANDNPGTFFIDTPRSELEYIDGVHPLLAPPPMPGQVWAWVSFFGTNMARGGAAETMVTHVNTANGNVRWATGGKHGPEHWPPEYTVLVAGPTPWGRDIPWSPA
jgi:hypothetical protein